MIHKVSLINSGLIDAIKAKAKGSPMETLAKILPISKEALYRRLRGDVLFTYSEAVLIARILDISLDKIGYGRTEQEEWSEETATHTATEVYPFANTVNLWSEKMLYHASGDSQITVMTSALPLTMVSQYRNLVKFDYYMSLYQSGTINGIMDSYESVGLPEALSETIDKTCRKMDTIKTSNIITNGCFSYYIKRIKFLKELEVIGSNDIKSIKQDLYSLLEDINVAMSPSNSRAKQSAVFYLSEVDIDNSLAIIDNVNKPLAITKTFGINFIVSTNNYTIKQYKHSIESMKNFSTVISQSGSKKRLTFLKKQVAALDKIE